MLRSSAMLLSALALTASFARADGECKPDYQVKYEACAHPAHGTKIESRTVLNLLAHEGAGKNIDGLCADGHGKIQASFPGATNFQASNMKAKENGERGTYWDNGVRIKKDIYCDFTFDVPVALVAADENCPIAGVVQASSCYTAVQSADVDECLAARPDVKKVASFWTKAACLLDAKQIAFDLSAEQYAKLKYQIEVMTDIANRSEKPDLIRLRAWLQPR